MLGPRQLQCEYSGSWMASSSSERVNQRLLTSLLPASLQHLAAKLSPPPSNHIPVLHPAPEGRWIWLDRERGTACKAGEGGFLTASRSCSPSLCFSLTVRDSSWIVDCSHTLSPPMADHIPSLPHLTLPLQTHPLPLTFRTAHGTMGTFISKRTP